MQAQGVSTVFETLSAIWSIRSRRCAQAPLASLLPKNGSRNGRHAQLCAIVQVSYRNSFRTALNRAVGLVSCL
jgi:hypothetical protein